jgi:signal transduction histidine kinase
MKIKMYSYLPSIETGVGLGLKICKELVKKNGGTFTISSNKGTVVQVSFST